MDNLEHMKKFLISLFTDIFLPETKVTELSKEQQATLSENTWKHTKVFLINLAFLPYLVYVIQISQDKILILTGLLGVIVVFGGAWFVVSFGTVPSSLSKMAFNLTFWMFLSFTLSLEAVAITLIYIFPYLTPFLIIVFLAAYLASVKYDTADSLKIGLEPEQYKLARYGSTYFQRELENSGKKEKKN